MAEGKVVKNILEGSCLFFYVFIVIYDYYNHLIPIELESPEQISWVNFCFFLVFVCVPLFLRFFSSKVAYFMIVVYLTILIRIHTFLIFFMIVEKEYIFILFGLINLLVYSFFISSFIQSIFSTNK